MSDPIFSTLSQIVQGVNSGEIQSTQSQWLTGQNLGGTSNAYDSAFSREFAAGYAAAESAGTAQNYFLNFGTGIAPVDQTGKNDKGEEVSVRAGDVFSNGQLVANVFDAYGPEEANLLMTQHWVKGSEKAHGVTYADKAPMLQQQQNMSESRKEFDTKVEDLKDDWNVGTPAPDPGWVGAATIGGGAVGGALAGGTIGSWVFPGPGTAVGAGLGALAGGIGGWLNRDEFTDLAARSEVQARMLADEDRDAAALAQRGLGAASAATRMLSPLSQLTRGIWDASTGETGDAVSEFYRVDEVTGEAQRPAWLLGVDIGASLIDAAALFGGGAVAGTASKLAGVGPKLYQGAMGGVVLGKTGVLVANEGASFDERRGDFDSIFTNEQGQFDAISTFAGLGEVAIDAVQMFAPSAFSGMLGRAGLTTGNKAADLALGLAGSKYTTLAGRKFTVDAATDTATAVARTPSIQVAAPQEMLLFAGARTRAMVAKARSGGGVVDADDLYQASKALVGGESRLTSALINGFGEGTEEAVQAFLEPLSHEDFATFEDVAMSAMYGMAMGVGMSVGAQSQLGTQKDRARSQAELVYALRNEGKQMPTGFWEQMTEKERSDYLVMSGTSEQLMTSLAKEFSEAEARHQVEFAPELAAGVEAYTRAMEKERETANVATDRRYQLGQAHYAEIDDHMVQGSFNTVIDLFGSWRRALQEVSDRLTDPAAKARADAVANAATAITTQLAKLRAATYARTVDKTHRLSKSAQTAVMQVANLYLQMNYEFVPDPGTQSKFAKAMRLLRDARDAEKNAELKLVLSDTYSDLEQWARKVHANGGTPGPDFARAVTLTFGRDPQNVNGSTQLLLPQISISDTFARADNYLRVTHGPLQSLSADFDGDMLNLMTRILLDDAEYAKMRIGTDLYTADRKKPVNLMQAKYEPVILERLQQSLNSSNKAMVSNANSMLKKLEKELLRVVPFAREPVDQLLDDLRHGTGAIRSEAFIRFMDTLAATYTRPLQQRSMQIAKPALLLLHSQFERLLLRFQQDSAMSATRDPLLPDRANVAPVVLDKKGHERFHRSAATWAQMLFLHTFGSDMFRKFQKLHYTDWTSTELGSELDQRETVSWLVQLYEMLASKDAESAAERVFGRDEVTANVLEMLVRLVGTEAGDLPGGGKMALALIANIRVPEVVLDKYSDGRPKYSLGAGQISLTQFLLRMEAARLETRDQSLLEAKPELKAKYNRLRNRNYGQAFVEVFGAFPMEDLLGWDSWVFGGNVTINEFAARLRNQDELSRQDEVRALRSHASYKQRENDRHNFPILPSDLDPDSGSPTVTAYQSVVDALTMDANTTISWDPAARADGDSLVLGRVLGSIGDSDRLASQDFRSAVEGLQQLVQSGAAKLDPKDWRAWRAFINSDAGLAKRFFATLRHADLLGAFSVEDDHMELPEWVYRTLTLPPVKAEAFFWKHSLLASYQVAGRTAEAGELEGRSEFAFTNRWHKLMWELEEEFRREPLSMARDRFWEQLLSMEDLNNFTAWTNNNIRGNEAPYTAWNSDIAELDPSVTKGGLAVVLEGAEQRTAFKELSQYVSSFARNHNQMAQSRADDASWFKVLESTVQAAQHGQLDAHHNSDVYYRMQKRIEFAEKFWSGFGPQARSRMLTMNMMLLAGATDKGSTAEGFKALGQYLSRMVGLEFGTPEMTGQSSMTAASLSSIKANPQWLLKDSWRFVDETGRQITSEPMTVERFVELWKDENKRDWLMSLLSPTVYEHVSDDMLGLRYANGLSLTSLLTQDWTRDLLTSNSQHMKQLYLSYLETVMDSREASGYISEVVYSQTASRNRMLAEYDEANAAVDRVQQDLVDVLRGLGEMYYAKPAPRVENGAPMLDSNGDPVMEPPIDTFLRNLKEKLRNKLGAPVQLSEQDKKIQEVLLQGYRIDIARQVAAGVLSDTEAESMLAYARQGMDSDFFQKAILKYADPSSDRAKYDLINFVHEHAQQLLSTHQHVTGLAKIVSTVRSDWTRPDPLLISSGLVTYPELDSLELSEGDWVDVAGAVMTFLITRETTTPLTDVGAARIPQVKKGGKAELDLTFFDPFYGYLVDHLKPLAKGAADMAEALGARPADRASTSTIDIEEKLWETLLNPARLGTWTDDKPAGIQQGLDRMLAGAEVGVSRAGSGPSFIEVTGVAYQRTLLRPPPNTYSTASFTMGQLRAASPTSAMDVVRPDGTTDNNPMWLLNGRFVEGIRVNGQDALTDPIYNPKEYYFGKDANGVQADPNLGSISLYRLETTIDAQFRLVPDDALIEVEFYHPEDQPDIEAYANNLYFEGVSLDQGDSFLSSEATMWHAPGGIDQRNEQAALSSAKNHTQALLKPDLVPQKQVRLLEAGWQHNYFKMLLRKTQRLMEVDLGDGTTTSAMFFNEVLLSMKRRHLVRYIDPVTEEPVILTSEQVIAMQVRNEPLPADAELYVLSASAHRTMLSQRGRQGELRAPAAVSMNPLDVTRWKGRITDEHLRMLPGLVATRKEGSKIVFDTRDISETSVVNTGQLLRLSRLSGVDEKTRVRFAQMFTKLQALGAQIGNERLQLQNTEVLRRSNEYALNVAVKAMQGEQARADGRAALGAAGPISNPELTQLANQRAMAALADEVARDGEGVWRVYHHIAPTNKQLQSFADLVGVDSLSNSGKVDYTWVSAFDRIVVNLDSFGNYASREQQEVELGRVLMKLMNTGAMVVLVNDSASFSGLNHFGTQFLIDHGYMRVRNSKTVFKMANFDEEYLAAQARFDMLVETRLVETRDQTVSFATPDLGMEEQSAIILNPQNGRRFIQDSDPVLTEAYGEYLHPTRREMPLVREAIQNALQELEELSDRTYRKNATTPDPALRAALRKAAAELDDNGYYPVGSDFGTGDILPRVRTHPDGTQEILLLRHGHKGPDPYQLKKMFSAGKFAIFSPTVDEHHTSHRGTITSWTPEAPYGVRVHFLIPAQAAGARMIDEYGVKYVVVPAPRGRELKLADLGARPFEFITGWADNQSKEGQAVNSVHKAIELLGIDFTPEIAKFYYALGPDGVPEDWQLQSIDGVLKAYQKAIRHSPHLNTREIEWQQRMEHIPQAVRDSFPEINLEAPGIDTHWYGRITDQTNEARITRAVLTYLQQDGAQVEDVLYSGGMNSPESMRPGYYARRMPRLFTDVFDRLPTTDPLFRYVHGKLDDQLPRKVDPVTGRVVGARFVPGSFQVEMVTEGRDSEVLHGYLMVSRWHSSNANPAMQKMAQDRKRTAPASAQRHAIAALTHRSETFTSRSLTRYDQLLNRVGQHDLSTETGVLELRSDIAEAPALRPRVSYGYAENYYRWAARKIMYKFRAPLTMDSDGGWTDEKRSEYNNRRNQLAAKFNLPSGNEERIDYWIRQRTGAAHDQESEEEGGNPGRIRFEDAMQELANIEENLVKGWLPTYALLPRHSEVPIMHALDLALLFHAAEDGGGLRLVAGPEDPTKVTNWNDWVRVALSFGMSADEPFDAIFLLATDGMLHTYHGLGVAFAGLPMSVNPFRDEKLVDPATSRMMSAVFDPEYQRQLMSVSPHRREELREKNLMVARASLEDMFRGTEIGLTEDDADAPRTSAGHTAQRLRDARKKKGAPAPTAKTTKSLLADGIKLVEKTTTANAFFRSLYSLRASLALLNPLLTFGAPAEASVQAALEYTVNVVQGNSIAAPHQEMTPALRQEYRKTLRALGSNPDAKSMIGREFKLMSQLYGAGTVEAGLHKVAQFAGRWQDPYWGMPANLVMKTYLESAVRYLNSAGDTSGITASMLASHINSNPEWLVHAHPKAHKAAINTLLNQRNVKATTLSLVYRGAVQPMTRSSRMVPQLVGHLGFGLPYMFMSYNLNKAVQVLGLQGADAFAAQMLHGRKKIKILESISAAIEGREPDYNATYDMSDAIETLDLSTAFLKSGVTHTGLFVFGAMAGGLGLSGDDEEDRRRKKAARYHGFAVHYDPLDIRNDFRNASSIYLDWLPEPLAEMFRVTDPTAPGGSRSMAEMNWVMKSIFNPIIGMERYFNTGDPREITWAYQDAFGSMPLVNAMMWDDANRVFEELTASAAELEATGRPQDQPEAFNKLVQGFMRYERMLLESSFLNQIYTMRDTYDRDPYAVVKRRDDGSIVRDLLGRPERSTVLTDFVDEDNPDEVQTGYVRPSWQEATWRGFTENRLTLALLSNLFTKFSDNAGGYLRSEMVPKIRTIDKQELGLEEARLVVADLVNEMVSTEQLLGYAESELGEDYVTVDDAKAVVWGLWKGSVSLDSPALEGFYMTSETRKIVKAELIAALTADYMAAGLDEYKATQFAWDAWKGSSTNPTAIPLNDIVMSDEISYKQSDKYFQLNTTYIQGPDGMPWATGLARNSLFNLFGLSPLQKYNAGDAGMDTLDQVLNVVDPVRGINTGLRSVEKYNPSMASDADDPKKSSGYTSTDGSSSSGSGWINNKYGSSGRINNKYGSSGYGYSRSGGGSGGSGGGSFTRMTPPENQQVPYSNDIDSLNTGNSLIRRAQIRRERIDSQKGRLKPWQ